MDFQQPEDELAIQRRGSPYKPHVLMKARSVKGNQREPDAEANPEQQIAEEEKNQVPANLNKPEEKKQVEVLE